jgi:CRISPR-associated protein Csb2
LEQELWRLLHTGNNEMFALVFRFPVGRYHATPWGRNANEADVAWPPEPWRILRALVATWWRKGNREQWGEQDLAALIDALAEHAPVYRLPDQAVHTHTRHYMPQGKIEKGRETTALVFDAFARLPENAEIVAAWPSVTLPDQLFGLAADLADGIGYLGRAESWVDCEARAEWNAAFANCLPEEVEGAEGDPVRLIAPCSPNDYATERERHLASFVERQRLSSKAGKPPAGKALEQAQAKAFGPTLPQKLVDAIAIDTSDYQRFGWSRPPASREVLYLRRPLAPIPGVMRRRKTLADDPTRFTVARFVLAGKPRPRIEETVKIGELMRLAALAQFGWTKSESGRRRPNAPAVISGRDADNQPLREQAHAHAFWLPEDVDEDGEIDHVIVYAKAGFDEAVRQKLDRLTKLWIAPADRAHADANSDDAPDARQEWRLALEGFGKPEQFRDATSLLAHSTVWESVTPFLASGHLKTGGYPAEVRRVVARRGLPEVTKIAPLSDKRALQAGDDEGAREGRYDLAQIIVRGRSRRAIHFHRFRSRGGESQPDSLGTFLRLTFSESIEGPLALGYGSHFGLGLFRACL